jgi:hypothetical protein
VWYIITHKTKYFKQYFYFIPTFYKKNIPNSPAEQKRSRKSEAKMDDRINSPNGAKALKEPSEHSPGVRNKTITKPRRGKGSEGAARA